MKTPIQIQRFHIAAASILAVFLFLSLRVAAQAPTITTISPTSAAVGETLTITGTNFSAVTTSNHVLIGGVKATVTAASSTSLAVTVPAGVISNAPVSVLNTSTHLWVNSNQFFKPAFAPNKTLQINADLTLDGVIDAQDPTGLYGFATGDFDDDGKLDIVVSDAATPSKSVYVRRNISTTSIAFANAITITENALLQPGKLFAIADLDGDAKLDIIVPGTLSHNVAILRNTSVGAAISFTSVIESTSLSGTFATVAADFDGDGKIDLASAANGVNRIIVSTNTSSGPGFISFSPTTVSLGSSDIYSLAVADINDDGKQDIIAVTSAYNVEVYRNTSTPGSMSFVLTTLSSVITQAFGLVVGDIDGDTKPDIIVNSQGNSPYQNQFATLRNTSVGSTISFSQVNVSFDPSPAAGYSLDYPALADINGDGKLDYIVSLNYTTTVDPNDRIHRVAVFNNTSSTGSISFSSNYVAKNPGNFHNIHGTVLAGDFNGDGKPDVLTALNAFAKIAVFRNTPQFAPTVTSLSSTNALSGTSITVSGTNFNSTASSNTVYFGGAAASVTAASSTSLTVTVPASAAHAPLTVLNTANLLSAASFKNFLPAFSPNKITLASTDLTSQGTFSVTGDLYGMAAGDLTKDGSPELIVSNYTGNTLTMYQNASTSGGIISYGSLTTLTLTGSSSPRYISIADLDGNGWLDMVVPNYALSTVGIYLNPGTGSLSGFTLTGSFGTGAGPIGAATGDLDGDGMIDMVTANNGASTVSVLRNSSVGNGNVSFGTKQDFAISASDAIYNVTLADLDSDGKLDIIVGRDINSNPGKIAILRNISTLGNINFEAVQYIDGPRTPWTIIPSDIDGDGLIDLVVGTGSTNADMVSVFRNTSPSVGTISFAETDLTAVNDQLAIAVADLNGDGKPDIIGASRTALSGTNYIHLFRNTSTSGSISFGTRIDLTSTTLMNQWNMVATDMNKDGKPDILVGNIVAGGSTVAIYRNTLIAPPVTQATNITVTATGTTAALTWTNGSGAKRAVFVKQANTGAAAPVTGTDYTASTVFGSGTQIGSTGWYCVFNGTGSSVSITGLTASVDYIAMVTEFNDGGLTSTAQYNTNSVTNNPKTFTTPATIVSVTRAGTSSTVNSSTVNYNVLFGSTVANLTTSNFSLAVTGGISGASVTAVSGSGTSFTTTVNTGTGDGTITLRVANAIGLSPTLTNTLPFVGETYTIDKTVPTLSPVSIASNNSITTIAYTGNIITVSFTANEAIATPTVSIAGGTASVSNTSGNNWTASYTITGTEAGGAIPFTITFSDVPGNAGAPVTSTTNSSSVVHDKTAPTLSSVTIASDNTNTSRAREHNFVTLKFTSSETIGTPVVTIAGTTVTANNTSGNNWQASREMKSPDVEGTVTFSISFSDLNSNAGTVVTTTTNSSSVVYDVTGATFPSVTIVSNNSNPTVAKIGDVVTLNFTSNETITPTVSMINKTIPATNTGGNNWTASYTLLSSDQTGMFFSIESVDLAGNVGTIISTTTNNSSVRYSQAAPLASVDIASNNIDPVRAKVGDIITVSISASLPINPVVTIAGHAASLTTTNSGTDWKASYTMTSSDAEGTVPFVVNYTDLPGNPGVTRDETTTLSSTYVVFDKTVPTTSRVSISTNNSSQSRAKIGDEVQVFIQASEFLQTPTMSIAGHNVTVTNNGTQSIGKYTLTGTDTEGTIPFTIAFKDLSGNSGTTVSATSDNSAVVFDKTNPILSNITISSDNSNTAFAIPGNKITLRFTANEGLILPTVTISGQSASTSIQTGNTWQSVYIMTAANTVGPVSFSIAFKDLAGNPGTAVTATSDNSAVDFQLTANKAPAFTSGTTGVLAVCANSTATSINNLLAASDVNTGQTLTWTIVSGPSHGTVTGLPATATTNGGTVTPSNISYQPTTGYTGTDAIVVRVSDGSLSADLAVNITVNSLPTGTLTISPSAVLCGVNGFSFLTASGGNTYSWFRDGVAIGGNSSQLTASITGTYSVVLISAQGCSAPVSNTIVVTRAQPPVPQFSFNTTTCVNIPVVFTDQSQVSSSGAVTYAWSDNNGHSSSSTSPSFTYSQAGNFAVKLKITPTACPTLADSLTKTVSIVAAGAGVRLPTVDVAKETLTQLQARAQSGATYSWVPSNGLTNPSIANPQIFTSAQQEFKIIMNFTSGCTITDTLLVRVQQPSAIYVPNVFTPNGDGQNDKLVPTAVATIKTLRFFRVFNRWGKMLYETTQLGQGWDGRYNGELQPLDTYTWVIEGVDANGQTVKKQGSVTLLR